MLEWLRIGGPPALALLTALLVDRCTASRGLLPPAFAPVGAGRDGLWPLLRRAGAASALALALWVGVFLPLATLGQELEVDPATLDPAQLFLLHAIFTVALGCWLLLAFGPAPGRWRSQLGLRSPSVLRELGIGVAAGLAAWALVLGILLLVGLALYKLAGDRLLPEAPPAMVPWLVALPVSLRLAVSLSAGVVEETFFRGFLQPRVGIGVSSLLFVLAHLSYEQPLMLVGIALLSAVFALLVRWRQSVWAAIAAHTVFDAVQLVVIIPWAIRFATPENLASGLAALGG